MKKVMLFSGVLLLIGGFGCAPRLAETPLSENEEQWGKYVKQNYPDWKLPQTIPPSDKDGKLLDAKPVAAPAEVVEEVKVTETIQDIDAGGKVLAQEKVSVTGEQKFEMYTVQRNDSLWKLSRKFYKKSSEWQRIKDANQDVLKGSDRLKPGMELRIPLL